MDKIRVLLEKYWDILAYLFFGVLTTAVNYLVYLPCFNLLHMSASWSNIIAWVVAVAFAYLTNKPWVFKSHDWSRQTVIPELTKFVGCRVGSGALETGIIPPTINLNEPDEQCDLNYVPHKAVHAEIDLALSNSLGFGGHNACLAFRKV